MTPERLRDKIRMTNLFWWYLYGDRYEGGDGVAKYCDRDRTYVADNFECENCDRCKK